MVLEEGLELSRLREAAVSETAVAANYTTRACWLEWRDSNSCPHRSERRALPKLSYIPAWRSRRVSSPRPLGRQPSALPLSYGTTMEGKAGIAPAHRGVAILCLSALATCPLADGLGFEPRSDTDSKSAVLPLHHPSPLRAIENPRAIDFCRPSQPAGSWKSWGEQRGRTFSRR